MSFRYAVSFLGDVFFIIFKNEYTIAQNQRLWGLFLLLLGMSDNLSCIGFDIHLGPFKLSYEKPVDRGYIYINEFYKY